MTECPHCGAARDQHTRCCCCDNVHADTRKLHPRRWQCVKHPVTLSPLGFVSINVFTEYQAYGYCWGLNFGNCPLFKERHEATETLQAAQQENDT